jgi:hypothetical protein
MIPLFKRRKRLMLSYTIYFFFAVWFIPLAIIIYGIYKKSKKFWLTGICLIPIFLIVMPVIAMFLVEIICKLF